MMQKKKAAIIQMVFLFAIQWLSIAIIILNALALNSAKKSNQGLIVAAESGSQEYILLIMSAISLLASSLLLITYLQIFLRLLGDHPQDLSKRILAFEIGLTLVVIALWSTASGVIVAHFNEFSACKRQNISTLSEKISFDRYDSNKLSSEACSLANAMITVGFITIVVWFLTLIVSVYSLLELNDFLARNLFIMQAPIHPYEDVKVQINQIGNSNGYKHNSVENMHLNCITTTKTDVFVTTVVPEKAIVTNEEEIRGFQQQPQQQQQQHKQKQGERGYRKAVTAYDLQQNQPQELKPVKSVGNWNLDFSFEPIQVDLMLPSTSELIGSEKKKTNNNNPYYRYL